MVSRDRFASRDCCAWLDDVAFFWMKAITALKKGAQLLKYGRRGKPKFCPFKLSAVSFSSICLPLTASGSMRVGFNFECQG